MKRINFSIGPVMMHDEIKTMGAEEVPYFRTTEFSDTVFNIEKSLKSILSFSNNSKALLLTGSGSLAMEAAMSSLFDCKDKLLIINGGTFGQRFIDIANIYGYNYVELKLEQGQVLTEDKLIEYLFPDITAIVVNHHETSTGIIYDLEMIQKVSKKHRKFLLVDAISSFIAEDISNASNSIDCLVLGSQKGLALPPGLSILVLSENAINKSRTVERKTLYMDVNNALISAERGQTPFTPSVSIILQLEKRLESLINDGINDEREKIIRHAKYFRKNIFKMGLKMFVDNPSNALTPIYLENNAYKVFEILKDEFNIWVAPSGGEMRNHLIRVGHLGNLKDEDYDRLIQSLKEIKERGII